MLTKNKPGIQNDAYVNQWIRVLLGLDILLATWCYISK